MTTPPQPPRRRHDLSEAAIEQIEEALRAGTDYKTIATAHRVHVSTVGRVATGQYSKKKRERAKKRNKPQTDTAAVVAVARAALAAKLRRGREARGLI